MPSNFTDNMHDKIKRPMIDGISGGSGVGKTTVSHRLSQDDSMDVTLISHYSYYKCLRHLSVEEQSCYNYDHPDAFDADFRFIRRLKVERGRTVEPVIGQYLKTVHPMYEKYVEHSRVYADLIIVGRCNDSATARLIDYINTLK